MVKNRSRDLISVAVYLEKEKMDQLAHLSIDREMTKARLAAAIVTEYLNEHSRRKGNARTFKT